MTNTQAAPTGALESPNSVDFNFNAPAGAGLASFTLHGYASLDDSVREGDMTPLYEAIMQHAPRPEVDLEGPFQMRISQLDYNNFVGVIGIGRIQRGGAGPESGSGLGALPHMS